MNFASPLSLLKPTKEESSKEGLMLIKADSLNSTNAVLQAASSEQRILSPGKMPFRGTMDVEDFLLVKAVYVLLHTYGNYSFRFSASTSYC